MYNNLTQILNSEPLTMKMKMKAWKKENTLESDVTVTGFILVQKSQYSGFSLSLLLPSFTLSSLSLSSFFMFIITRCCDNFTGPPEGHGTRHNTYTTIMLMAGIHQPSAFLTRPVPRDVTVNSHTTGPRRAHSVCVCANAYSLHGRGEILPFSPCPSLPLLMDLPRPSNTSRHRAAPQTSGEPCLTCWGFSVFQHTNILTCVWWAHCRQLLTPPTPHPSSPETPDPVSGFLCVFLKRSTLSNPSFPPVVCSLFFDEPALVRQPRSSPLIGRSMGWVFLLVSIARISAL